MKIKQIVNKKQLLIVLGLLLVANGVFGVSFTRKMAKPAFITALAAGSWHQMHCDTKKQAIPHYFAKVLPGVTAGFDHVKFEKLKNKYLDAVNRELEGFIDNQPQEQERQLLAFPFDGGICDVRSPIDLKTIRNDLLSDPEYCLIGFDHTREAKIATSFSFCDKDIDPEIYAIILKRLQKNCIDPKNVYVSVRLPDQQCFDSSRLAPGKISLGLSVYSSRLAPGKILLEISAMANDKNFILGNEVSVRIGDRYYSLLPRHLLETLIEHEICHIVNKDDIVRDYSYLKLNQDDDYNEKMTQLFEKRADMVGIFNSPSPFVMGLVQHVSEEEDVLYEHRKSKEWNKMIDEIKGCYDGGLQEALESGKIEHVEK